MAAPVCFQAPSIAPATSVAVSFDVWCGGGLGKQRWKMGFLNLFSRTALANSVAVSFGVWCGGALGKQRWKREGCGGELLSEFFLRSLFRSLFSVLERDLSGLSTWHESIGWRKTQVLCHSLTERFLDRLIIVKNETYVIWLL